MLRRSDSRFTGALPGFVAQQCSAAVQGAHGCPKVGLVYDAGEYARHGTMALYGLSSRFLAAAAAF